ncbi:MAG: OmpA family protein [Deltaproteobacteria bacterium]|nr:OmpA family protein [Deltaproteobacteria bacterium]
MGSLLTNNSFKIYVPLILIMLYIFFPSLTWCEGYQEQKLFDGKFYSSEDLKKKVETHTQEIQVLDDQIRALETDVDWMILKINGIQDSGRTAPSKLKESISKKEEKIHALLKSKNRLENLVQHYSATLSSSRKQELGKLSMKKVSAIQKSSKIKMENISSKKAFGESNRINKSELQAAINQAKLSDWVEITGTGTCLRIETTLPILFPTGSAKVANEYTSFFKKLARFLKPYDVKILVNGYADTVPIHNKKYPSNFELGATRAANIVHHLVNYGLKPSIFQIKSTGNHRFAAKGLSKQKSLERRAEVTIIFSG